MENGKTPVSDTPENGTQSTPADSGASKTTMVAPAPIQLRSPSPVTIAPTSSNCTPTITCSVTSPPANTQPEVAPIRYNQVGSVLLHGVYIVSLVIDSKERLCLAQISNTLLKAFSYNEIHNRRVALGITCVQCTPVQLEILRRAGAMPVSSRRCGMITKREAERLVKSFLDATIPPQLPENFAFNVVHECGWGGQGSFIPSRYNSSRAKCIKCHFCNMFFSPNKFIFHFHRTPNAKYNHPDAANFNSWRRHLKLVDDRNDNLMHAWEDVKAMFNGGSRKRIMPTTSCASSSSSASKPLPEHNSQSEVKKSKFEPAPRNAIEHQREPTSHAPAPENMAPMPYPVFSPDNKPQPIKTMPSRYNVHFYNPSPAEVNMAAVKSPPLPVWPNVPESYYAPYEMIWAKHLGLNSIESSFPPLHPSAERPKSGKMNAITHTPYLDHGAEHHKPERPGLIGDRRQMMLHGSRGPYPSAFTPVIHRHRSTSETSDQSAKLPSDVESRSPTEFAENARPLGEENEADEHVDVDTIDEDDDAVSGTSSSRADQFPSPRRHSGDNYNPDFHGLNYDNEENNNNIVDNDKYTMRGKDSESVHSAEESRESSDLQSHSCCDSPLLRDYDEATYDVINSQRQQSPRHTPTFYNTINDQNTSAPHNVNQAHFVQTLLELDKKTSGSIQGQRVNNGDSRRSPLSLSEHMFGTPVSLVQPSSQSPHKTDGTPLVEEERDDTQTPNSRQCETDASAADVNQTDLSNATKEQLQMELERAQAARRKLEEDCKHIKESLELQAQREMAYREDLNKQLQVVRESFCQELDLERQARLSIQQKLKEANEALKGITSKVIVASRHCSDNKVLPVP